MNEQEDVIHSFYGCNISIEIFVQKKHQRLDESYATLEV